MENGKRLDSVREIQEALCSFRPNEHVIVSLYEQDVEPHVEGDVTFEARVFSGDSIEEVEAPLRKFIGDRGLRPRTNIVYRLQCRPDSGLTIGELDFMDALIFERDDIESVRWGGSINAEQEEKIRLTVLFSTPTPVMMYLHGFMSGANGAKQRQLQERFKGRYRVIAPELDADPEHSLEIINREIERERPEIIIGTSLGGFMALECKPVNADVVIVNPCLFPQTQLAQCVGEEHTYFCKRLDGVQTYTLTQETLDKYGRYDAVESVKRRAPYIAALCSTADDLLGDSHVKALTGLVWDSFFKVVDDFGHQCKDAGMTHLYDLLELVIDRRRRMGGAPRTTTLNSKRDRHSESRKCRRVSIMGAWARDLARKDLYRMKDILLNHIDEILADPRQASAFTPPVDDYSDSKNGRLGAYLSWCRDNGRLPDSNDRAAWVAYMKYTDAFPVCNNPMHLNEVLNLYRSEK